MNITFDASGVPVDYMADGLRDYVESGVMPGSFLTRVLENSLSGAVTSADVNNRARIVEWVNYAHWSLPANCWGSPAKVAAWHRAGGLRGLAREADA